MADLAPLAHRRRSGARRASNVMKSCWQRLYEHPAVREAAVIGVADEALGEEVAAAVVAKEGQSIDELPKDPTGKILEREITVPEVAR
ncbi:MAG: hypothetical protein AVDCRST_MAG16-1558 [uncultured Frankineae bacterium]|uniref:AMP-binding enzyme C-terminal domain-containing protein n=1 Tax=uncultured Frankineae bacterium TaxID=437475 RepID=A0A6J4LLP9_9ACTN|nr:MAG: hypothetical protein AVDCRST_MAG16-1558 [uncultured Frankineae bacterium]